MKIVDSMLFTPVKRDRRKPRILMKLLEESPGELYP